MNLVAGGGGMGGGGGAAGGGGGGAAKAAPAYSASYSFDLYPADQGEVGTDIPANAAHDENGAGNQAAPPFRRVYDGVPPSVALAPVQPDLRNMPVIAIEIAFTEPVTHFDLADLALSRDGGLNLIAGAQSLATVDSIHWTLAGLDAITAETGHYLLTLDAADITDLAGNAVTGGGAVEWTMDTVCPAVTCIESDPSGITHAREVVFTINFSEPILGFDSMDLSWDMTGTVSFEPARVTGGPSVYIVHATNLDGDGALALSVGDESDVTDRAGNPLAPAAATATIVLNHSHPAVAIESSLPDPTNASPMLVGVTFSEPVSGFESSDVVLGNATLASFEAVSDVYARAWLAPMEQGIVTMDIAANVAVDNAGNGNLPAAPFRRIFDSVAPMATMTSPAPAYTHAAPISVAVHFTEPIAGLAAADFTPVNATLNRFDTVSETYATFDLLPGDQGLVAVDMESAAHDAAGNAATTAHFERVFDTIAPSALIELPGANPTDAETVAFLMTFDEPVLLPDDLSDAVEAGGSLAEAAQWTVTGADGSWVVTVDLSGSSGDGTIGIVPARVSDRAGNVCAAAVSGLYTIYRWTGFREDLRDMKLYAGDTAALSVAPATANPALAYHWKYEDADEIVHEAGVNSPTLTLAPVTMESAGVYWCEVAHFGTRHATRKAEVAVAPHLAITRQPAGAVAGTLRSFIFTVRTAGGHPPLEYQWKKNGLPIPNATGEPSLLLTPLKAGDTGTYSVVVSDSGTDSVESQGALLTAVEGLPAAGPFTAGILALALLITAGYRSRKQ